MNTKCTDLDRDFQDLPDDPEATKERIMLLALNLAVWIVIGVIGVISYFSLVGKPCSAHPYCSEHKIK